MSEKEIGNGTVCSHAIRENPPKQSRLFLFVAEEQRGGRWFIANALVAASNREEVLGYAISARATSGNPIVRPDVGEITPEALREIGFELRSTRDVDTNKLPAAPQKAEPVEDGTAYAKEAIIHAVNNLMSHLEVFHDSEVEGREARNLRHILNHLQGTLIGMAESAALRAQHPAPQVKELEWVQERNVWVAETIVGTYSVGFDDGWWATLMGPNLWDWAPPEDPRFYSGPHAGQLAAQSDYERRILSALSGEAQR